MVYKEKISFQEETEEIIREYCLLKKINIITLARLYIIKRSDNNRAHTEKMALLAKAVTSKMGFKENAKAAFFGGLIYHNSKGKIISYNFFDGCDNEIKKSDKIKNFIKGFSKVLADGNLFIAYCTCLDHFLREKGYVLTAKDFPCPDIFARKFLKIARIVGKIIAICDETIKLSEEGIKGKQAIKKLEERFFGDTKIIKIAVEETRKLFNKKKGVIA